MTYGVNANVRAFIGNPPTSELADAAVNAAIATADSMINSFTGNNNWQPTDQEYPMVCQASSLYAAFLIRSTWRDIGDEAEKYRAEFWNILKNMRLQRTDILGLTGRTEGVNPW